MPDSFITRVALAGNPNCGKTVLFNALTGSCQRVGNWPGVTVERKSGSLTEQNHRFEIFDLPGIYSLSVVSDENSLDARIAYDFLQSGTVDLIVNIIDGSNLERNLYLTLQLLEMQIPMIIVVNMMDIVEKRGIELDLKTLSQGLGCKVVPMTANRGKGITELKTLMTQSIQQLSHPKLNLSLAKPITQAINDLQQHVKSDWLSLRLLEGDLYARQKVTKDIIELSEKKAQYIEQQLGEEPDILIADARYEFINEVVLKVTHFRKVVESTITQTIDKVVLHRIWGIPTFLFVMYLMFVFAINIGGAFQDFFDISSTVIFVNGLTHLLMQWHWPTWLIAIIASGIGKGINTTITFIPVIAAMFLFLAFLEDCGYMARASFVMDRCMSALGLPGKSFVPMIVGFGCNVPAVMGARTLANRRDRIITIMMMPFMSCGARLAIFAVFASAFFPSGGQDIIFILYISGILVAVATGLLFRKTLLPGKPAPLVMELPPYHMPRIGSLTRHAWSRLKRFITRAGKVILPVCVLIGALNAITVHGHLNVDGSTQSLLSAVGRSVTPILKPMGVQQDNWPATVGLATGVLAKEVVVGTLNTLYGEVGHAAHKKSTFNLWHGLKLALLSVPHNLENLGAAFANPLKADESPHEMSRTAYGVMYQRFSGKAGAFAYLLFVLLYFPCVSTMAVMRRELSRRWAYFSVAWNTLLAYTLSVIVYQLLTIDLHVVSSLSWLGGLMMLLVMVVWGLKYFVKVQS